MDAENPALFLQKLKNSNQSIISLVYQRAVAPA
jgi:hypothetical protein